jgi:hypothetical protein
MSVINPLTGRRIKINGQHWQKLVRTGVLKDHSAPQIEPVDISGMTQEEIDDEKRKISAQLPSNYVVCRGINKKKNQLIVKTKPLTQQDIVHETTQSALKAVRASLKKNARRQQAEPLEQDDYSDSELEKEILQELTNRLTLSRTNFDLDRCTFDAVKYESEDESEDESEEASLASSPRRGDAP